MAEGTPTAPEKRTIFLVDDEQFFRTVLSETLEENGYTVTTASSGEEAIRQASAIHPDVIILDVVMPGMDGFATCQALASNALTRHIPVIMLTGSADPQLTQKAFSVGAAFTLPKSSEVETLLRTLTLALAQRRPSG